MNTGKYVVSFKFTPNERYKSALPEKLFIKSPLGNIINPELSQKSLIQLHDMASIIDEIVKISNTENHVKSKQTFDTDYGQLLIKIETVFFVFSLFRVCLLTVLTASLVFVLTYFVLR